MFLNQELTPKEAWLQLRCRIVNNNKSVKCAPLVLWLQAVLTKTAKNGPSAVQVTTNPTTPNTSHLQHRVRLQQQRGLLLTEFSNLDHIVLQGGCQAIASNINALVADCQAERATKSTIKILATIITTANLLGAAGTSVPL